MTATLKYDVTGTAVAEYMRLKMTSVVEEEIKRFQHLNKARSGLIIVVIWMPCGHFKHCFISAVAARSPHHQKITFALNIMTMNCPCTSNFNIKSLPLEGKEKESSMQFPNSQIGPDSPLCAPVHFALSPLSQMAPHSPNCLGGFLFSGASSSTLYPYEWRAGS